MKLDEDDGDEWIRKLDEDDGDEWIRNKLRVRFRVSC